MRGVYWIGLAKLDYYENIDFLIDRWSEKMAQDFIDEVSNIEFILTQGVVDFQATSRPNIRRCLLCKQIVLYYRIIDEKNVELLRFWNSYQDESRLTL